MSYLCPFSEGCQANPFGANPALLHSFFADGPSDRLIVECCPFKNNETTKAVSVGEPNVLAASFSMLFYCCLHSEIHAVSCNHQVTNACVN
jgi:hypothetical protein